MAYVFWHHKLQEEDAFEKEKLLYRIDERDDKTSGYQAIGSNLVKEGQHISTSPIPVSSQVVQHHGSAGRDRYYM